jgi:hypothetical protein
MGNESILGKLLTIVSFIIMVLVNILANILPINNMRTMELYESYPNLFMPASYTYIIWIPLSLLLCAFSIYQFNGKLQSRIAPEVFMNIRIVFSLSSLCNVAWVFAWHYDFIALSVVLVAGMLGCMTYIGVTLTNEVYSIKDYIFIRIPFGIYRAWLTIATIMNITVLLVSIRWQGFGLSESLWTIIILVMTLLVVSLRIVKFQDIAYCLTVIWSLIGIFVNHYSKTHLNRQYPEIMIALVIIIIVMMVETGYLIIYKKKNR